MSNQNEEILLHFQKCKNLEMHGREGIKFPLQIFILGDIPSSYYTFPLDVGLTNAYAWLGLHLIHKWWHEIYIYDAICGIFVQMLLSIQW